MLLQTTNENSVGDVPEETKNEENELVIIDENSIKNMIYEVRGQKVMLDFDLARIYGYSTSRFNEQVKNNIAKFDDDFRFQLTKEELKIITISKKSTSIWQLPGTKGGRTKPPYAFTEMGVYMLMTVLKGELAIQQSITLIRLFQSMKTYIAENKSFLTTTNEYLEGRFFKQEERMNKLENKFDTMMKSFDEQVVPKHFLILDGQKIEADVALRKIYSLAKKSILLVDDYIDVRTLSQFKVCPSEISIILCSDNVSRDPITEKQLEIFTGETGIEISIIPSNSKFHDRYIVIDYGLEDEIIYHSGSSSKDSGNAITTIMKIDKELEYHPLFDAILKP